MRLWSIHPQYLDAKGLVAAWREALLARKVLAGQTQGYRHHPQLIRFKNSSHPLAAIHYFLHSLANQADQRGYHFNRNKLDQFIPNCAGSIPVTSGQLEYEFQLLKHKLAIRNPQKLAQITPVQNIELNPLFYLVDGGVEGWEKMIKRFQP